MRKERDRIEFKNTAQNIFRFCTAVLTFLAALAAASRAPIYIGDNLGWNEPTKKVVTYCIFGTILASVISYTLYFLYKRTRFHLADQPLEPLLSQEADVYRDLARLALPLLPARRRIPAVMVAGIASKATMLKYTSIYLREFVDEHLEPIAKEIEREADTLDEPIVILSGHIENLIGSLGLLRLSASWAFEVIQDLPDFPDEILRNLDKCIRELQTIQKDLKSEPRIEQNRGEEVLSSGQQARKANFSKRAASLREVGNSLLEFRQSLADGLQKCTLLCESMPFLPNN